MKKLSASRLAQVVSSQRKSLKMTQKQLAKDAGINRALLSRIETEGYIPSVDQLLALSDVLQFDINQVFENLANLIISLNETIESSKIDLKYL